MILQFTSTRSTDNIRLYQNNGYTIIAHKDINDELRFVYVEKLSADFQVSCAQLCVCCSCCCSIR